MVINSKQTTVAYRCPRCGAGVMSAVNVFALSADMVKLKCTCGESEMTITRTGEEQVRLSVPCLFCAQPHNFTLNNSLFFEKEIFALPCPYSGFNIGFLGEINMVKGELARSELELLDWMEKNGIEDPSLLQSKEDFMTDPQIRDVVMFVINDLDAEGKIFCKCAPNDEDRAYEAEILDDCIRVTCKKCGATATVPTDSSLSAHAFLNTDFLHLT